MACCQDRQHMTPEPRTRGTRRSMDDRDPVLMHNGQTTGVSAQVSWRGEQPSGGATFVVVMQTADVCDWDDRAAGWRVGSRETGASLSSER
jgi:hypothetical protein